MSDEWVPVSGLGTVFSFVIVHPPVLPAFQAKVPFAVVLVELEESSDLRLVGNLLDCPLERITIGLAVEVAFEELSDTLTLPQWRPR